MRRPKAQFEKTAFFNLLDPKKQEKITKAPDKGLSKKFISLAPLDFKQTFSTAMSEQSTPPQKKPTLMRKSSQLQQKTTDDKQLKELNRVQSSNVYMKPSYVQLENQEYQEVSFGEQESTQQTPLQNQFRNSSRRFALKINKLELSKCLKDQPSTDRSGGNKIKISPGSKSRLPEIFQATLNFSRQQNTLDLSKKESSKGFRPAQFNKASASEYNNEFNDMSYHNMYSPETHRVKSVYDMQGNSLKLPRINSAIYPKQRTFIQSKAQNKIIDRIFSAKSQN